jgi:hypothetical protein
LSMIETAVFTSAANAQSTVRMPVAGADTSLRAQFAWLPAVSTAHVDDPSAKAANPAPDAAPALRHFQRVLDRLGRQQDEGDISALSEDIANWSPDRARATRTLLDD